MIQITPRARARKNRLQGEVSQRFALDCLVKLGIECEPLKTGWTVIRDKRTRKINHAYPNGKVLADIVGVRPWDGRAVLVEVKSCPEDALPISKLEKDQRDNCDRWLNKKALVFVAWVHLSPRVEVRLIPWGINGWGLRHALPWADSQAAHHLALTLLQTPGAIPTTKGIG